MKKPLLVLSSLLVCLTLTFGASTASAEKAKEAPAAGKPVNKKCPVEGGEVDASEVVVYKGKTVAFCCAGCDKEFNKDPEKYMKQLAAAGDDNTIKKDDKKPAEKSAAPAAPAGEAVPAAAEEKKQAAELNKQCLVNPKHESDASVTSEHKGKKYAFCCESCQKKFDADPEKYVPKAKK